MILPPNARPIDRDEFQRLEVGDVVISKQFGEGIIRELYGKDQVIVRFRERRVRLSTDDHDLMQVQQSTNPRQSRPQIQSDGVSMSLSGFKRQQNMIKNEYITIAAAAKVMGISKVKLEKRIAERNIETRFIGGKSRISISLLPMLLR